MAYRFNILAFLVDDQVQINVVVAVFNLQCWKRQMCNLIFNFTLLQTMPNIIKSQLEIQWAFKSVQAHDS